MFKKILLSVGCLISCASLTHAKNIEYSDNSCQMANANLISLVDEVAKQIGYEGDYELVEPTRAGILANPFNRMMYAGVNSLDQNDLILINQDWFKDLDLAAQQFLIAVNLLKLDLNKQLTIVKLWPYVVIALSILMLLLVFWLLNKTYLARLNIFLRFVITIVIVVGCEWLFIDKISADISRYLEFRQAVSINQRVIAILDNQPAAIRALAYVDQTIKAGIADGHSLYKPHEFRYENLIKKLN